VLRAARSRLSVAGVEVWLRATRLGAPRRVPGSRVHAPRRAMSGAAECLARGAALLSPEAALIVLYCLRSKRPLIRARRSLTAVVLSASSQWVMSVSILARLRCDEYVVQVAFQAMLAVGIAFSYLGLCYLVTSLFLRYVKIERGQAIAGKCSRMSGIGQTLQHDSELIIEDDNERRRNSSAGQPSNSSPPAHLSSSYVRLALILSNRRYRLAAHIGFWASSILAFVVPFWAIAEDPLYLCKGVECFDTVYFFSSAAAGFAGVIPAGATVLAYFGMKRSAELYGDDSLGVKKHLRMIALTVVASQTVVGICGTIIFLDVVPDKIATTYCILPLLGITIVVLVCFPLWEDFRYAGSDGMAAGDSQLLERFLCDRERFELFKRHLQSEFCLELILFYEQACEYKAKFTASSMRKAKLQALQTNIIQTFLVPDAELELNLPSNLSKPFHPMVRPRSKNAVIHAAMPDMMEDGPSPDIFDAALAEVLAMMASDPLLRFTTEDPGRQAWTDFLAEQAERVKQKHDLVKLEGGY